MIKKILIAAAVACVAVSVQAQGIVNFNTRNADVAARIFDVGGVTPLNGTAFYAQLYAATGSGASEATLTAKGSPVNFQTTAGGAGYVVTAAPANPNVSVSAGAGTVTVQLRAWSSNFATYELAEAAFNSNDPTAKIGKSNLIDVTAVVSPTPANDLVGLTGFTMQVASVPEPSTIALGVMGLSTLLFRRRK